jgi:hypothetical protein
MPEKPHSAGFVPTLEAAAATARMLAEAGLEIEPTEKDLDAAANIAKSVAATPGKVPAHVVPKQTAAALLMTQQILEEFGHKIVQEAERVRHLVTNKLVIETENPDPRVRLRALELLGKMGDVGLFTEKKEVTITHQTSDDVRERLRARLARLIPPEMEDAEVVEEADPAPPDDEIFDLSLEPRLAPTGLFDA